MLVTNLAALARAEMYSVTPEQAEKSATYLTMTVGGSATLLSALRAHSKFSARGSLLQQETKSVVSNASPRDFDHSEIAKINRGLVDGDTVIVDYELTEPESRVVHLERLESEISSLQSSKSMSEMMAMQAMMPKTEVESYIEDGQTKTRVVMRGPDIAMAHMHRMQAQNAESNIRQANNEVVRIQSGGVIELVREVGEIETMNSRLSDVDSFLKDHLRLEHKLISVNRVPKEAVLAAKSLGRKGWVGVVMSVTSGSLTLLEVASGFRASNALNVRVFQPLLRQP